MQDSLAMLGTHKTLGMDNTTNAHIQDKVGIVSASQKKGSKQTQMQIVLSAADASNIEKLKEQIEAGSYGELVRRALQLYEEFLSAGGNVLYDEEETPYDREITRSARIKITITQSTRSRMDRLKILENTSYSDVIRRALGLLAEVTDKRHRAGNAELIALLASF